MRKFLAFLLTLCMVFALCACGGQTSSPADMPSPAPTGDGGGTIVKIGLICLHDQNSTYDLNFINGFKEACEYNNVESIIKTNIPEGNECYEAAAELVDAGCNIIFADSFGHEDFMIQAAREFPDVQFCHATGTQAHTVNLDNFHNAFASIYQGRYLAGIAAGLKLNEMIVNGDFAEDEALIGYVGAYPYAEVISGYTSFFLGARSVCPSVTMDVTFTGTWYDESLEKEAANTLINHGCKLISQHADSMGAPSACENAGIPDVSYNGSTVEACPNTFIVSSRIDWAPYFNYIINCVKYGDIIDTDYVGTIMTGSVKLTDVNTKVAATETIETLEAVKQELIDGNRQVFDTSTFTVNGEHLTSYLADVDTDPNYEADTEVIKDGVFYESSARSAPYFDLHIDGITILK